MMLTHEYINPLIQFGQVTYDLCLYDGETCVYRAQASFPETVSADDKSVYANGVIESYEAYIATLNPVPAAISPRQIRMALTRAGLRDAVEAAVEAGDWDLKDWWGYSTAFERHNPLVDTMAAALGVSDAQVDDLWRLGDTL